MTEEKGIEAEVNLYPFGFAHFTGLSNSIFARHTVSTSKIKRTHRTGEFFRDSARSAKEIIRQYVMNIQRKIIMRTQTIYFPPDRQTPCVFPYKPLNLQQAISDLGLKNHYPVIVLIGGLIDKEHAALTQQAINTISKIAQDRKAVVVCGGTNMGIMAEIGNTRRWNHHNFPLFGVAPEELVTWPNGPESTKFLWWGKERWHLEPHYSHFMLVPGKEFGDESPWIDETATILSKRDRSVTILINGGEISRKDIELSLDHGRPVIVLSRTGRLADELASQPEQNNLITVIPANAEQRITEVVQAALSNPAGDGNGVSVQATDHLER